MPCIYDHISSPEPNTGYRIVRMTTKDPATGQLILKRGVIDTRGNFVISLNYAAISTPDADGNRVAVLTTIRIPPGGITSENSSVTLPLFGSGTGSFNSQPPPQTVPSTGAHLVPLLAPVWKMGIIDQQERTILPFIYDHFAATAEPETGYRVVRMITKDPVTGGLILKRGVIDQRENLVVPALYDTLGTPNGDGNRPATVVDTSGNIISGYVDKYGFWHPNN